MLENLILNHYKMTPQQIKFVIERKKEMIRNLCKIKLNLYFKKNYLFNCFTIYSDDSNAPSIHAVSFSE